MESEAIKKYFLSIEKEVDEAYEIANAARKLGYDPEKKVDIPVARNMAERVEGLISAVAPQILGSGIKKRIQELEKNFGFGDWRISLVIAEEVAKEKFCKFKDLKEAIETGIRVGFAYHTNGIVAAPLEGFVEINVKKRRDGKEYLAMKYAGPIRGAGGTAASFSVVLADYVRKKFGFERYDPDENEVKRVATEIEDYHERVTNLQYKPSEEEVRFLVSRLPVEVDGDPTEQIEVSNYKDLPRIGTNRIRGGVCLVIAEGISQKAPKIWKQISKWHKEYGLEWDFLEEFISLQKVIKSGRIKETEEKVAPNYTYLMDIVAGRPVLSHPMRFGGFRLRYGRCRNSGYSCCSINPALMHILKDYLAIGTQLKLERPGKATVLTTCDTIDGPIVLLKNGDVMKIDNISDAKKLAEEVQKILFLGDMLVSYGDFFDRGHVLLPPGYCEEIWVQDLEKAIIKNFGTLDYEKAGSFLGINADAVESMLKNPILKISADTAINISERLNVPLHPRYTYYWKALSGEQLKALHNQLINSRIEYEGNEVSKIVMKLNDCKKLLEMIGLGHKVISNEFMVLGKNDSRVIDYLTKKLINFDNKSALEIINSNLEFPVKDKAGCFIGARMGRPEKAKMRKLTGSPQVLFPVGEEGGRLRSFQSAMDVSYIEGDFPIYFCESCKSETIYPVCETCDKPTKKQYYCKGCGIVDQQQCKKHGGCQSYVTKKIDSQHYFTKALEKLNIKIYPDLIKGVRGTSNKDHIPENLIKGILRAKQDIYVNKDGTTRYDMTEIPITHFKPKEIGTSTEKLKNLGYLQDIYGNGLANDDQILELKPQDVILPACHVSLDEPADDVLIRIANFVDELLVNVYKLKPFYNFKTREDTIGALVIGLAPHISAGMVGRVIGYSQTQGCFAHPLWHAALRRDCYHRDTYIPIFKDGFWHIKKIGDFVEMLQPDDVVDDYGTRERKVSGIKTIGKDNSAISVNNFTKHTPQPMVKIKTKLGRTLTTTLNHKHCIFSSGKEAIVRASELSVGDKFAIPYKIDVPKRDLVDFDLLSLLAHEEWVMVRGVNKVCKSIKKHAKETFPKKRYENFIRRDSYPLSFINNLIKKGVLQNKSLFLAAKRDTVVIPSRIMVTKELLQLVGLYVAEGYSRAVNGRLYQVYIAAQRPEIRNFIKRNMHLIFGLKPSERKKDRITYSSRILYKFFTSILGCGSSAYGKRIPSQFLALPNKKLGHILSGYFEGDGSVSETDLRVTFDTVSEGLLRDLDFVFSQLGIFVKNYTYTSFPGPQVRAFYERKGREIPKFTVTKGIIQSVFVGKFAKYISFISKRKQGILAKLLKTHKPTRIDQEYTPDLMFDTISSIEILSAEESYCLNVQGNTVIANSIRSRQCDGDEACFILLMDALLNFSRQFLPDSRGGRTMDSPLVLTIKLVPSEVDDMVHRMDVLWKYPLEYYKAAEEFKQPSEVSIEKLGDRLMTELQYEKIGFTHNTSNINSGVLCSAYKTIPNMEDKLKGQMELAEMIAAVETSDVARLVIEKHFLKDTKGNLRKFSMQQFRCVKCGEKYRRPPLIGKCLNCGNKLIFTVSEGSIIKYLEPSFTLAEKYNVPAYLKQTLDILRRRVEGVFGKEKDKQEGLTRWFAEA